jgi:ribosome biogenesis GTPase
LVHDAQGYNSPDDWETIEGCAAGFCPLREEALVLVSYGGSGLVELDDGSRRPCKFKRSVGRPLCGDRVTVGRADAESVVVTAITPRRNEFVRVGPRGRKQPIAANLDQVLIVVAPAPEPSRDLVERYLVAVHGLGLRPVLVLNKAELMDTAKLADHSPLHRLDEYRALGYEVLETSCKGPPGTEALPAVLDGRVNILVGQSGVGKSSLANALLADLKLQTRELSRVTGKGTHTTTTTVMYALPCGGRLIDSPGVWEYGLWEMTAQELAAGFVEFRPLNGRCRFNDCRHAGEPGCAVRSAAERGEVFAWRYESYLRLLEQAG